MDRSGAQCRVCASVKSSAAAMRWCSVPGSAAARIKVGGCEAKSLCPNAQTKTHVSTSLQSDHSRILQQVASTPRARPTVYAQRNAFPRPVLLLYAPQAPCQPIAKRHAAMEPLACKDQMRTQAPCKNGMRPLRPCLRVQVCNAGRRMPGEGSRREEPLIRQRQLHGSGACIVHSDGQRPAHRHTNACTSAANRHGCGGRACP